MKVKWKRQGSLAEAVSTSIEMCLINEELVGICVPVRCKDFISDAYYAEAKGFNADIWGFRFKTGSIPGWKTSPLRLAMRIGGRKLDKKDAKSMNALLNAFPIIGEVSVVADEAGNLVIIAAPAWSKSPWRISLLTMLMRQGLLYDMTSSPYVFLEKIAKEDNSLCPGDKRWVGATLPAMKTLMQGTIPPPLSKKDSYEAFESTHECHHAGGFYSSYTGQHTG